MTKDLSCDQLGRETRVLSNGKRLKVWLPPLSFVHTVLYSDVVALHVSWMGPSNASVFVKVKIKILLLVNDSVAHACPQDCAGVSAHRR